MSNGMEVQEIDIPELAETFADHVGITTLEGHAVRIELQVTRLDKPDPPNKPTGRRYPVARLVLTPPACLELHNALQGLVRAMVQAKILKPVEQGSQTIQ